MIPCLVFLFIFFIGFFFLFTKISHSVHKSQVRDFTEEYGRGNFKIFLRHFTNRDWERCRHHRRSFFIYPRNSPYSSSEIHAGIIKFDGKGMLLDYWSYLRFLFWEWQHEYKPIEHDYKWN